MNKYFPSQIVEYIDRKFPEAKGWTGARSGSFPHVGVEYAASVGFIANMIKNMPQRVMTLRGDDFDEFSEAIESIRLALNLWHAGEKNRGIQRIAGRDNWHPITIIRKHLIKLSDGGIDPGTASLSFITDKQYRDVLCRDVTEANSAFDNGEWKAATVLSGSIIEALLLDVVKIIEAQDLSKFNAAKSQCTAKGIIKGVFPPDLDTWNLNHLIEVSSELSLISPATAAQCRIARDFRNLVHPGRALRETQICDRGTALSAVAGLVHLIRDLSKP